MHPHRELHAPAARPRRGRGVTEDVPQRGAPSEIIDEHLEAVAEPSVRFGCCARAAQAAARRIPGLLFRLGDAERMAVVVRGLWPVTYGGTRAAPSRAPG